ncbi:MAG: HK97 family phage prohead protease [Microthrixaceae bacterium]
MATIDDIDLIPTDAMVDEAVRGLAWRQEFGRGGTAVGVARARDISNRVRLSADTVQRMASFFARHEVDKQGEGFDVGEDGYPSAGRIAWALWGGDPGMSWANARLAEIAALESERSFRMIDLTVNPINGRQTAEHDYTHLIVDEFGQYDQSMGANGAGYVAESGMADHGMVCANCIQFEEGMCHVVTGEIAAGGLCKLYIIPESLMVSETPEETPEDTPVEDAPVEEPAVQVELDGFERGVALDREVRKLEKVEIRATEDGGTILEGYATVYDYAYSIGDMDRGGFMETIAAGAAAKSANEADVRLLINHEGIPLARTKSGTMTLTSDDIGLRVMAELDPTNPVSASLRSAMERGDMDQMSFAFRVLRDEWSADYSERKIYELKLFDVSMVTYPANPATVAKVRNDDTLSETASGRSVEMAKRQLEAITARR